MDVDHHSHPTWSSAAEDGHMHLCELCGPLGRLILRSGTGPGLVLNTQDRNGRVVTL